MKKFLGFFFSIVFILGIMQSCSHDEEVRMPGNIVGIWSPDKNNYLTFKEDYTVFNLEIISQDDETIGLTTEDAYLYEPGYNLVIYLSGTQADVYQILNLSNSEFTWCWVDEVTAEDAENYDKIGKLIGDIIKKAQEGFTLNPELYETFHSVSEQQYLQVLESLNYIW